MIYFAINMLKPNLLYFNDTETSSGNVSTGQIITSAFIITDANLKELARYEAKINFENHLFKWEKEAEAVHKIPQARAMLHGCKADSYLHSLKAMNSEMLSKHGDHKAVFVAQNAFFDFGMHKNLEETVLGSTRKTIIESVFGYKPFDTSVLFATLGNWNKSGLSHWVSPTSEANDKRHDAMYDTEILVDACRTHLGPMFQRLFG